MWDETLIPQPSSLCPQSKIMNRTIVVFLLVLTIAPDILAQSTTPAPDPAAAKADAPAPKQDQGVRKLSRRERKERMKNLSEADRQFLQDVEPIMLPSELDTFL